jgi:hypothetical protein
MRASPPDEFYDLQWTIYSKREGSAFGPLANFGKIKKQEEQTSYSYQRIDLPAAADSPNFLLGGFHTLSAAPKIESPASSLSLSAFPFCNEWFWVWVWVSSL